MVIALKLLNWKLDETSYDEEVYTAQSLSLSHKLIIRGGWGDNVSVELIIFNGGQKMPHRYTKEELEEIAKYVHDNY